MPFTPVTPTVSSHNARIEVCADHANCNVIIGSQKRTNDSGVEGGSVVEVSRSHMSANVEAKHRLNLDHPTATDARPGKNNAQVSWEMPGPVQRVLMGVSDELARRLAYEAAARGHSTFAALAATAGSTVADIRTEAAQKGWDSGIPADRRP